MIVDAPSARGDGPEMMVVGGCHGCHLIEAASASQYYLPFKVAAVIGALLAMLVWVVEAE